MSRTPAGGGQGQRAKPGMPLQARASRRDSRFQPPGLTCLPLLPGPAVSPTTSPCASGTREKTASRGH